MNGVLRSPGRGSRAYLWGLAFVLAGLLSLPARAERPVGTATSIDAGETASAPGLPGSRHDFDALMQTAAATVVASSGPMNAGESTEIDRGRVSWYGGRFHGRRTASGERYDMHALTAAHKTLPFGTRVKVRDLGTGREVEVRINDRGPHVRGRVIDLSRAAALALGVLHAGEVVVALVRP
jgi:rare lipoprotein A